MDGTGDHHVKQDKPGSERQVLLGFAHMQNLDLIIIIINILFLLHYCRTDWEGKSAEVGKGKGKD
jgi:hypothetical protein